ncbi:MAG: HIRAN domain-containing protein, partial [Burkholderiales bacterium]|nr:HIRAN domain-containing protein [Burkholderiales bacterium]
MPTLSMRGGLNLALPLTADTVPEARLREVGQRLQEAFVRRYTELQRRAVFSGRYFPTPLALVVDAQADGAVRVVARFAPGYLFHGDEVAMQYPPAPKPRQCASASVTSAIADSLSADLVTGPPQVKPPIPEPVRAPVRGPAPAPAPAPKPSSVEPPLNLAQQLAPAQTALLLCDFVAGYGYYQGDSVIDHMHPGDPLTLRPEPGNPHDALAVAIEWRVCKLGYVPRPLNQVVARLLTMGQPLQARTVA